MNIIPFDTTSRNLPAYLANRAERSTKLNKDVVGSGPSFPVLSIKGKVFTLVKGTEKKVLTRDDDPDEVLQSINLTVVRANTKSRVFYAKAYTEGESDGAKPTCFSNDGVGPDAAASEPQAKKCAVCPQNVWGVKDGKGTACTVNTRLAVIDPITQSEPFLLRVPPASRKGFADAVRVAETRGLDYNMLVMKVGFDKEAPSPKLTFKPVGLLDDAGFSKVDALYEDDIVKEIVGLHDATQAAPEADSDSDLSELDAAIAAKKAVTKAAAPAPAPAPVKTPVVTDDDLADLDEVVAKPAAKAAPKKDAPVADIEDVEEKPVAKAAPKKAAPAPADDGDSLLGDLDALLSATDD